MGHRLLGRPPRPRARRHARMPERGAGIRDHGDGAEPALPLARRPHRRRCDDDRAGSGGRGQPRGRRGAECGLRRDRGGAPGHLPDPESDEGPRSRHRQPALDSGRGPPRRGALGPEHRRGDLSRASRRGRDRRRGQRALGAAPARDHVADVPRLRQRRRRRRRALRRGEERDRARRRWRRRPRARRQRKGCARGARARRDGAVRRGRGREARDLRRASPAWAT